MSHAVPDVTGPSARAVELVEALVARGWTLAVAESLTGGLVLAAVVDVPGASRVLRGGVVAYATELKATLLGVDPELLVARGAVDADVAIAMAAGARDRLGADLGLGTTGVAGPDPQDGHAPGTVHVAAVGPLHARVVSLHLTGGRDQVRRDARDAVLALALDMARPAG